MYARTTLLEIDTVRVPLDDALTQFEDLVVPRLQGQRGFAGLYAMTTEDGRAMLLTFWESAEARDAYQSEPEHREALQASGLLDAVKEMRSRVFEDAELKLT